MTSAKDNSEQIARWSGSTGDTWTHNQEALDSMLSPLMPALLEQIHTRPGERIADIGCGCGALSLELARQAGPQGQIVGLDVSPQMLGRAKARAQASGAAVDWIEADAATYPLKSAAYDALVSRFGVMFFYDPAAAFRHLRGALKPEGRLVFLCWRTPDENPWAMAPAAIMARHVEIPRPPPGYQPGPFAFADRGFVREVLSGAGFANIAAKPVDVELGPVAQTAQDLASFHMQVGPASRLLDAADDPTRDKVRGALVEWAETEVLTGRFAPSAGCWLVTATL